MNLPRKRFVKSTVRTRWKCFPGNVLVGIKCNCHVVRKQRIQ
jgi:hypothetical protein